MSSQEIEIIREKARNEGFAQGRAEGAATVRASTVVALKTALASSDTESILVEVIDHLESAKGDEEMAVCGSFGHGDPKVIRDQLLGRTAKAAPKPGETMTQAAERMLIENGIGAGKRASSSAPPDLGDQVVALLQAERGKL
jgi:hypothetical protein